MGTTVLFALQAALELGYNVTSSAARRGQDAPKVFQRSRMAQQPTNVSVRQQHRPALLRK